MSRAAPHSTSSPRRRLTGKHITAATEEASGNSADDSEKSSDVGGADNEQISHASASLPAASNAQNRKADVSDPSVRSRAFDKFPPRNLAAGPTSSTPSAAPVSEREKRANWKVGVIMSISLVLSISFYGYLFYYLFWPLPAVPALPARVLGAVRECADRYPSQQHVWHSLRTALDDYLRPPRPQFAF